MKRTCRNCFSAVMLLAMIALFGCSGQKADKTPAKADIKESAEETQSSSKPLTPQGAEISVDELKKILDNKEDVFLLDVRSQREFDAVHVPDVDLVIPHTQVAQQADKLPQDKNRLIDVICRTGHRSGIAVETLKSLGYTNVHNVVGGTNAWVAKGYPVVRGN